MEILAALGASAMPVAKGQATDPKPHPPVRPYGVDAELCLALAASDRVGFIAGDRYLGTHTRYPRTRASSTASCRVRTPSREAAYRGAGADPRRSGFSAASSSSVGIRRGMPLWPKSVRSWLSGKRIR